jgi:hypothetical protein
MANRGAPMSDAVRLLDVFVDELRLAPATDPGQEIGFAEE